MWESNVCNHLTANDTNPDITKCIDIISYLDITVSSLEINALRNINFFILFLKCSKVRAEPDHVASPAMSRDRTSSMSCGNPPVSLQ